MSPVCLQVASGDEQNNSDILIGYNLNLDLRPHGPALVWLNSIIYLYFTIIFKIVIFEKKIENFDVQGKSIKRIRNPFLLYRRVALVLYFKIILTKFSNVNICTCQVVTKSQYSSPPGGHTWTGEKTLLLFFHIGIKTKLPTKFHQILPSGSMPGT